MRKEKFNIVILEFQSPSSPDLRSTDRRVCTCSQAATAKQAREVFEARRQVVPPRVRPESLEWHEPDLTQSRTYAILWLRRAKSRLLKCGGGAQCEKRVRRK
jgi:hypothetical protein